MFDRRAWCLAVSGWLGWGALLPELFLRDRFELREFNLPVVVSSVAYSLLGFNLFLRFPSFPCGMEKAAVASVRRGAAGKKNQISHLRGRVVDRARTGQGLTRGIRNAH